jgi:uncharacterized membrane protein
MGKRLQNWITTLIGAVVILVAVGLYTMSKFTGVEISTIEFVTLLILGYVFLMAKDTLLDGLFMRIFNIDKDDNGKS